MDSRITWVGTVVDCRIAARLVAVLRRSTWPPWPWQSRALAYTWTLDPASLQSINKHDPLSGHSVRLLGSHTYSVRALFRSPRLSSVDCRLSVCPASDLENYARCARNFAAL